MYKIYFAKFYNDSEDFYKVGYSKSNMFGMYVKNIPYEHEVIKQITAKSEHDAWLIIRSVLTDFYTNFFKYNPEINFKGNDMGCFIGNKEFMETQFNVSIGKYLYENRDKVIAPETLTSLVVQLNKRLRKENTPKKKRRNTKVKK